MSNTPTSSSLPFRVQFGIELEFNIPKTDIPKGSPAGKSHPDLLPYVARDFARAAIAEALHAQGLNVALHLECWAAACFTFGEQFESHVVNPVSSTVKNAKRVQHIVYLPAQPIDWNDRDALRQNRFWEVKKEVGIVGPPGSSLHDWWVPVEITTPVLSESEVLPSPLPFPKVNHAIRTAHGATVGSRVLVNQRCGMHVHVSPEGIPGGLARRHVKRLATLLFVIEKPLLFRLCAPHRKGLHNPVNTTLADYLEWKCTFDEEVAEEDAYLHPRRLRAVRNNQDFRADVPADMAARHVDKLSVVWRMETWDELEGLFSRMPVFDVLESAVALHDHGIGERRTRRSLEFRHAQASLSTGFVDNWALLVVAVFKACLLPSEQFKSLMERACAIVSAAGSDNPDVWRDLLSLLEIRLGRHFEQRSLEIGYWRRRVQAMVANVRGGMDVDENGEAVLD